MSHGFIYFSSVPAYIAISSVPGSIIINLSISR
nr:MAG TPA: hypothetical protein [Caudoviricetes sp.]